MKHIMIVYPLKRVWMALNPAVNVQDNINETFIILSS